MTTIPAGPLTSSDRAMASGDESRSRAEKLRSPSPSLYSKVIDISEVAMFHVNAENGDADEHECYSLKDLAHYVKLTNLKSTNEELAARVIETLGNQLCTTKKCQEQGIFFPLNTRLFTEAT